MATGGGLLLAIPAMFLYFFFRGQVSANMVDVQKALSHVLDLFTGEAVEASTHLPQTVRAKEFAPEELPDQA